MKNGEIEELDRKIKDIVLCLYISMLSSRIGDHIWPCDCKTPSKVNLRCACELSFQWIVLEMILGKMERIAIFAMVKLFGEGELFVCRERKFVVCPLMKNCLSTNQICGTPYHFSRMLHNMIFSYHFDEVDERFVLVVKSLSNVPTALFRNFSDSRSFNFMFFFIDVPSMRYIINAIRTKFCFVMELLQGNLESGMQQIPPSYNTQKSPSSRLDNIQR